MPRRVEDAHELRTLGDAPTARTTTVVVPPSSQGTSRDLGDVLTNLGSYGRGGYGQGLYGNQR